MKWWVFLLREKDRYLTPIAAKKQETWIPEHLFWDSMFHGTSYRPSVWSHFAKDWGYCVVTCLEIRFCYSDGSYCMFPLSMHDDTLLLPEQGRSSCTSNGYLKAAAFPSLSPSCWEKELGSSNSWKVSFIRSARSDRPPRPSLGRPFLPQNKGSTLSLNWQH